VNELLLAYLQDYYTSSNGDLTTLVRRYLDEVGGDVTAAFRVLELAAVAFSLPPE